MAESRLDASLALGVAVEHRPLLVFLILTLAGAAPPAPQTIATPPAPPPATNSAPSVPAAPPAPQAMTHSLDALMRAATAVGFSGTVLVAEGERVLLRRAYGDADRNAHVPVRIEMPFDIGSITKQFTAAAILRLEMQGKLDVKKPLSAYLDGVPPDKTGITLHHVLTHTAGLPEYSGDDYAVALRDSTVERILATPVETAPGSAFAYSNAGYSLLAAVVEHVAGEPYERFLDDACLRPAGLTRTGYRSPHFDSGDLPHGYPGGTDQGTPLDHLWGDDGPYWNLFGNGGMLSTVDDLYTWSKALEGGTVLSAAAREELFTPFLREYAYGWNVRDTPHGRRIWHGGGSDNGFNALVAWYPERGIRVIVLSNAGETGDGLAFATAAGGMLERRLFDPKAADLPALRPAGLPASRLIRCEGTYRLPAGGTLAVHLDDSRLWVEPVGQDATNLLLLPPGGDAGPYERCSQRTASIVGDLARGDFSALARAVSDSARAARLSAYLSEKLNTMKAESGPLVGFDLLGTTPAWWTTGDDVATIVRCRFERANLVFRLHWKDGCVNALGGEGIASPARTPLVPLSATEFIGFHMGIAQPVRLRFPSGSSPAATLQVSQGRGAVTAKRVP